MHWKGHLTYLLLQELISSNLFIELSNFPKPYFVVQLHQNYAASMSSIISMELHILHPHFTLEFLFTLMHHTYHVFKLQSMGDNNILIWTKFGGEVYLLHIFMQNFFLFLLMIKIKGKSLFLCVNLWVWCLNFDYIPNHRGRGSTYSPQTCCQHLTQAMILIHFVLLNAKFKHFA